LLPDPPVRQLRGGAQAIAVEGQLGVDPEGPGDLVAVLGLLDEAGHQLRRHPRRHLAGPLTAHAVGDDVQAHLVVDQEGVLVDGVLSADPAPCGGLGHGLDSWG